MRRFNVGRGSAFAVPFKPGMVGVAGMVAAAGLLIAAPASAQESNTKKKDDGYGYVFTDDLLNAPGLGANAAQITVRQLGRRDRLLRPRVHFVPELLKSVEGL